tara:strand:+ start:444 stop:611 length:168 start_codon:yes stop_codon:yes gene_type:complete
MADIIEIKRINNPKENVNLRGLILKLITVSIAKLTFFLKEYVVLLESFFSTKIDI